jgi:hypothetical protein
MTGLRGEEMSDIKPDLLTKLAEKCASEHYGYGFDRQDLDEALLALGRELLEEASKELCGMCSRDVEYVNGWHHVKDGMTPKNVPYRRIQCASRRLRSLAGEGK